MKQYISRARIFVDRYVKDGYVGSDNFNRYLNNYEEKVRPIVARAICLRLIEKISLKNYRKLLKGLTSLEGYVDKDKIKVIQERIEEVCREYKRKKEKNYRDLKIELENPLKRELRRQGISGSAIEVNVEASPQWNEMMFAVDPTYNSLLNRVKKEFGAM